MYSVDKGISYKLSFLQKDWRPSKKEGLFFTLNILFFTVSLNGGSELILSKEASSKTKPTSVDFL